MQSLLQWDRQLLKLINAEWSNSFFDSLLPFLRNPPIWLPLYLFLFLFSLINYKKTGWIWALFFIGTVVLSDFVSSDLIKQNIFRLRPCNDPAVAGWLNVLTGTSRPQSSSFTSSHAANHFAMATFVFYTWRKEFGKWTALFFLWAGSIAYAQIYVGVHYPIDVTGGALVGILLGMLTAYCFNRWWRLI